MYNLNSSQHHTLIFAPFGFKYTSVCILGLDRSLRFISKVRDARSCELSQGNMYICFCPLHNVSISNPFETIFLHGKQGGLAEP